MIETRFTSSDELVQFAEAYLPAGVGAGGRFGLFFGVDAPVRCYRDAAARDVPMWHRFVRGCVERGIYFQSIGHAIGHHGISAAHTTADIDWALDRMDGVFKDLRAAQ